MKFKFENEGVETITPRASIRFRNTRDLAVRDAHIPFHPVASTSGRPPFGGLAVVFFDGAGFGSICFSLTGSSFVEEGLYVGFPLQSVRRQSITGTIEPTTVGYFPRLLLSTFSGCWLIPFISAPTEITGRIRGSSAGR